MTTKKERIAEWLESLPRDGSRFTTTDAYERLLKRWPAMNFSRMNAAQYLTRSGRFEQIDPHARDQVWAARDR